MVAKQNAWPRSVELEQALRRQIVQRTGGRIRTLEVQVVEDRVIIRGRAGSFYVKQLTLQGVLEVMGSVGPLRIELDVQVQATPPQSDAEVV